MSPKWKDNQPLTALTGRCLSEKVSLPLLHHRLFRMAELYPRPFHFVKKKFFGHNPRRQPRPFFNPRRSRHRNPQRHRRCRPLSEANTTCRHRAAITLGTKSRQPSHRRCVQGRYRNPQRRRCCRPPERSEHNLPPSGGHNLRAKGACPLGPDPDLASRTG